MGDYYPEIRFRLLYQSYECGGTGAPCKVGERQYSALFPRGEGPFPAVLYFHGSGGTGQGSIQDIDLVQPFLEHGYAFIAPTALEISYYNGPGTGWVWALGPDERDDFGFSSDVITDAVERFPLDPDRIVVAGHSRGGSFAWYLACAERDPRFRAFAPINGTPLRDQLGPCAHSGFDFDMLHTHGYDDSVIPFGGSTPKPGWSGYMGAVEVVDSLAALVGCETADVLRKEDFDQRAWAGCPGDSSISVLGFQGGHRVPKWWPVEVMAWFDSLRPSKP
ncbi:hypothetical protein [Roseibium sp. RKSG952]|uniref:alpha/beta hydrolase family esterase n=1 Tax=Roseibium sp. RKSG952 TaxID=2529384 RepID=UPI0012BC0A7B